jgi:hypothetical protein
MHSTTGVLIEGTAVSGIGVGDGVAGAVGGSTSAEAHAALDSAPVAQLIVHSSMSTSTFDDNTQPLGTPAQLLVVWV